MNRGRYIRKTVVQASMVTFLLIISGPLFAQKASATMDTTSIRIGEQVQLKLNLTLPNQARVQWPSLTDTTFAPVEIVAVSRVDTIETSRSNYLQYKQLLTVTAFDSGYQTIPPVEFLYTLPGESVPQRISTDSLILYVRSVEVDTTRAIRDIKPTMEAPLTLAELWPVFTGLAVVGLIAGFIWYYLWRRKMKKPLFPVIRKQQLPAWQQALEQLNQIDSRKLWQNGKYKEYYTEITDVLRTYLEDQFQIPAMEMISSEIIESMEQNTVLNQHKEKAMQVLNLADLVKFAKELPLPTENQLSMENTREFVNGTKPAPVPDNEVKVVNPVAETQA